MYNIQILFYINFLKNPYFLNRKINFKQYSGVSYSEISDEDQINVFRPFCEIDIKIL